MFMYQDGSINYKGKDGLVTNKQGLFSHGRGAAREGAGKQNDRGCF